MLPRVALVGTEVLEESIASIISAVKIGGLGKTLSVTSNRNTIHIISSKRTAVAGYC
jgi:hypothetical protein